MTHSTNQYIKVVTYLIGIFLLGSCSVIEGQSYYVKKNPKNVVANVDKKGQKEDIKSYKEHDKAIKKKKEELNAYQPKDSKKSRKKKGYN